jgi:integral membrane protein (TIGR01906 family)
MDYLVLNKEFSTGILKYSEEGKSHFVDVKFLFDLNFYALVISTISIIFINILTKVKLIKKVRIFDLPPIFYASILTILIPLVVGFFCVIDFNKAFTVFHHIFFPGKDNWLFDYELDQIINILPEDFFAACAALIGVSILLITLTSIIISLTKKHKRIIYFKKNI